MAHVKERERRINLGTGNTKALPPLRVTFDSNSWQRVVRPDSFPVDGRHLAFKELHHACRLGRVKGFISETVGTLEGIKRADRGAYFASRRLRLEFSEKDASDGYIGGSVVISSDHSQHPGLAGILADSLEDAFAIGFRLLSAPRMGAQRPAAFLDEAGDLRKDIFAVEADGVSIEQRLEKFGLLASEIEGRGVGLAVAQKLAANIQARSQRGPEPWFKYLDQATPGAEAKAVAKAIAEWADGDAVASHIAYGNDLFCTEDIGRSAGTSVLDPNSRAWLYQAHGVHFVSLMQLHERLHVPAS